MGQENLGATQCLGERGGGVFCTNHHALAPVTDNFAFDAATTTLTDSGSAVWHRF